MARPMKAEKKTASTFTAVRLSSEAALASLVEMAFPGKLQFVEVDEPRRQLSFLVDPSAA